MRREGGSSVWALSANEQRFAREIAGLTNDELAAGGFMRPKDVAAFLGISRSQVSVLIKSGPLPFRRIGHAICVPRVAVERWSSLEIVRRDRAVADA